MVEAKITNQAKMEAKVVVEAKVAKDSKVAKEAKATSKDGEEEIGKVVVNKANGIVTINGAKVGIKLQ